jgi:hypothetical protein
MYEKGKARFPVQTVIRPKTEEYQHFRVCWKPYGNNIKVGDANGFTFFNRIKSNQHPLFR